MERHPRDADLREILVVDDEPSLRSQIGAALREEGYEVREAGDGRLALGEIALRRPDAIVLDLHLPDISGLQVLRALRPLCDAPVLILSVLGDENNKVEALELGADDYLAKPFGRRELLARVKALLRRRKAQPPETAFEFGEVRIDLALESVSRAGRPVRLTAIEYRLLKLLVLEREKVVTHRRILREIWGAAAENRIQYVRTYMGRLRAKLGAQFTQGGHLQSESGIGYRLVAHPDPNAPA